MSENLIRKSKSHFKNRIKTSFKNILTFFSLFTFMVISLREQHFTISNVSINFFFSIVCGTIIAFTFNLAHACILIFQYFTLKKKLTKNEQWETRNFVKIKKENSFISRIEKLFLGHEKVRIVELNGKKISKPLKALSLIELDKEQKNNGNIIFLALGCYYVPNAQD